MKRYIYTLLFVLGTVTIGFSQAPPQFNYQAVARDANGAFMAKSPVTVDISLNDGTSTYTESHSTTTNQYGLFNLVIGNGKSPSMSLKDLNWKGGSVFISLTVNNVSIGQAQLLSVPYALYANTSGNASTSTTNTILNGIVPPTTLQGINGDYYIDNTTTTIYGPKANGTWPSTGTKLIGSSSALKKIFKAGKGINIDTTSVANTVTITNILPDSANIKLANTPTTIGNYVLFWNGATWSAVNTAPTADGGIVINGQKIGAKVDGITIDTNVTTKRLEVKSVSGTKITDSLALNKLEKDGAIENQVLKFNGTSWAPGPDLTGTTGTGITTINKSSETIHTFRVDTSATNFDILSTTVVGETTHSIGIPIISSSKSNAGLLSRADYDKFSAVTSTNVKAIRSLNGVRDSIQTINLDTNAIDFVQSISMTTPGGVINQHLGLPILGKTTAKAGIISKADYDKFLAISGTSQWNTNATGIDYTAGNVGIGTVFPTHLLDIAKTGADNYIRIQSGSTGANYSGILLHESTATEYGWAMRMNAADDWLYFSHQDGTKFSNSLTLKNTGAVVIDSLFKAPSPTGARMVTVGSDGLLGSEAVPVGAGTTYIKGAGIDIAGNVIKAKFDSAGWNAGKIVGLPVQKNPLNSGFLRLTSDGDSVIFVPAPSGTSQWTTYTGAGLGTKGGIEYTGEVYIDDTLDVLNVIKTPQIRATSLNALEDITGSRYTVNDSLVSLGLINTPKLRVSGGNPTSGQVLSAADNKGNVKWTTVPGATPYTAGTGIKSLAGNKISVDSAKAIWDAGFIGNKPVDTVNTNSLTSSTNDINKVLKWNGTKWVADTINRGGSGADSQTLSYEPANRLLTISGAGGNSVILNSGGTTNIAGNGIFINGNGKVSVSNVIDSVEQIKSIPVRTLSLFQGTKQVFAATAAGSMNLNSELITLTDFTGKQSVFAVGGKVLIGTGGNPLSTLDVRGKLRVDSLYNVPTPNATLRNMVTVGADGALYSEAVPVGAGATYKAGTDIVISGGKINLDRKIDSTFIYRDLTGHNIAIQPNPGKNILLDSAGISTSYVGIGMQYPAYKLHVNGAIATGSALVSRGALVFYNDLNNNTVTLQSGNTSADVIYTLPTAKPLANGYVLSSTTSGIMSWIPSGGSTAYTIGAGLEQVSTNRLRLKINDARFDTTTTLNTLDIKKKGIDSTLLALNVIDSSRVRDGYIGYSDLTSAGAGVGQVLTYVSPTVGWKPRSITGGSGWGLTGNDPTSFTSAANYLGTKAGAATDATSLRIRSNDIERMVIDSVGRVGINVKNVKRAAFEHNGVVGANATSTAAIFGGEGFGVSITNTANASGIGFNSYYDGGNLSINSGFGGSITVVTGNGNMEFRTSPSVTAANTPTSSLVKMTLTNAGYLGVSSAVPTHRLTVGNGIQDSTSFRLNGYGRTASQLLYVDAKGVVHDTSFSSVSGAGIVLPTGANKTLRYDNTKALWDTTSMILNNGTSVTIGKVGQPQIALTVNGRMRTDNITESSDIRYKTNIEKIGGALDKVKLIEGVSYFWKKDSVKTKKDIGVIAQELEKVLPELVDTDEAGYKSVRYSHLVPVLVEAIKEQQKQIETLKAEVTDKDNKVQNSESRIKTLESSVSTLSTQMQLLLELVGKNEAVKASK